MSTHSNRRAVAACAVLILSLIVLCSIGCATTNACDPMATWQRPELLYLLPTPYDRLLVEVDLVEGTEPRAEMLASLRRVLDEYCSKPRGTLVVHSTPIPLSEAKGKCDWRIALEHLDGPPPESDDGKTAFLYVLFYDSSRLGRSAARPHAGGLYPCAVYFDLAYCRGVASHFRSHIVAHELGHILGLCKNRSHGDGAHCSNEYCAMGPGLAPMRTWLFGISPPNACDQYCEDCQRDIEEAKKPSTDPRSSFRGPFYIRQEEGYYVATLPFLIKLSLGELDAMDWREELQRARQICHEHAGKAAPTSELLGIYETPDDLPDKVMRLHGAARDASGSVREMARTWLQHIAASEVPPTRRPVK